MVTLKNVTNILTALGELYLFRKLQNQKVWTAMFMMIISAISSGITDISFDTVGYAWQLSNYVLTASYSRLVEGGCKTLWSNAQNWEDFSTKVFHIRREKMKTNMIEENSSRRRRL